MSETIDYKLRELTNAGLFSHLSVYSHWGNSKTPTMYKACLATIWGQSHAESTDPVDAVISAINKAPKNKPKVQLSAAQVPNRDKVSIARNAKILEPQIVEPETKPKSLMEWLK